MRVTVRLWRQDGPTADGKAVLEEAPRRTKAPSGPYYVIWL